MNLQRLRRTAIQALDRLGLGDKARRYAALVRKPRPGESDDQLLRLLMASTLRSDGNYVDVGAHAGTFLAEALRIAPNGRHIAYEPLPHMAQGLRSSFPGATIREIALSNAAGTSSFVHVRTRPTMSGLRERSYYGPQKLESIQVTTARLDDDLPTGYRPDFIKVDVEGAELLVLQGAVGTLREHSPILVFEHGMGGADHYGSTPGEVFDLLLDVGYRIFDFDGQGPYTRGAFEDEFPSSRRWNFIAHR